MLLLLVLALECEAAAIASGRNWRIAIGTIECQPAGPVLVVGARVRYLGPGGAVEAPLNRLVDGAGRRFAPKSLSWKSGGPMLAQWLSAGGLRNIAAGDLGEVQVRFELAEARIGALSFEFGDIAAFALTRKRGAGDVCARMLKPEEISAPRVPGRKAGSTGEVPVHRARYPCRGREGIRTVEAEHPPYLPRRLLVFGRGFLPNAREIVLPMGSAPAQPYAYSGPDNLGMVEAAAQRALASDFPQYPGPKHFAFNWGVQRAESGNEMYSIGVYELRACPRPQAA